MHRSPSATDEVMRTGPRAPTAFGADVWLLLVVGAFVFALAILPMGRLLLEGVAPGGRFDLSVLAEVMHAKSTWLATERSLTTAAGGTLISVLIGTAFALLVALTDLRAKTALVFCFMIPFMVPPQITALSWIQLFGASSPLLKALGMAPALGTPHPLYSPEGIMLLLGIQHAPLVFLALRAGTSFDAARDGGGGAGMRNGKRAGACRDRAAADGPGAGCGDGAGVRVRNRQLSGFRRCSGSRSTTRPCPCSSTSGSRDSDRR